MKVVFRSQHEGDLAISLGARLAPGHGEAARRREQGMRFVAGEANGGVFHRTGIRIPDPPGAAESEGRALARHAAR